MIQERLWGDQAPLIWYKRELGEGWELNLGADAKRRIFGEARVYF